MTTKKCPGANKLAHVEDVSMFAHDKSRSDNLAPYCRMCAAIKQKEWKRRNPEKVRDAKRKYRTRAVPLVVM